MFKFLKKKKEPKNLKEILNRQNDLEKELKKISDKLDRLEKTSKLFVQKIGIIRYNPFSKVGSNQSFSIALLDGDENGIVITSLYTREGNRVYAKPIKNSQSNYQLSKEEKQAISQSQSSPATMGGVA